MSAKQKKNCAQQIEVADSIPEFSFDFVHILYCTQNHPKSIRKFSSSYSELFIAVSILFIAQPMTKNMQTELFSLTSRFFFNEFDVSQR